MSDHWWPGTTETDLILSWRRDEKLAKAKELSANPNRSDAEQRLLVALVRSLANITKDDKELRGGYGCFHSSGRGRADTPKNRTIIPGGLPGLGKRHS